MKTLKSTLKTQPLGLRLLTEKAGTTRRVRGREWMETRKRILERDSYACCACGQVGMMNEIDHIVPLEQGGSHADANLQTLCRRCHAAKTADEQRARHNPGGW